MNKGAQQQEGGRRLISGRGLFCCRNLTFFLSCIVFVFFFPPRQLHLDPEDCRQTPCSFSHPVLPTAATSTTTTFHRSRVVHLSSQPILPSSLFLADTGCKLAPDAGSVPPLIPSSTCRIFCLL